VRRLFALPVLTVCLSFVAQAAQPPLSQVYVTYRNALPSGIAEELTLMGVPHGVVLPTINAVALSAPPALVEAIAQDPRVAKVTPQQKLKLNLYGSVDQINARGVNVPEMIEAESGLVERPGVTGAGVTVAVIDSGVYAAHPGLLGRATTGLNFELSLLARELSGVLPTAVWDAYALATGALALQDEVGHGTHCAGIIGGDGTGASGLDLAGVAPGVNFVSMKLASAVNGVVEDIGFEANAVAAIDYLIRHNAELGVRVASNSWGILAEEAQSPVTGPTDFGPLEAVTRAAVDAGIVMVFAAGNDGGGPEKDTLRPVPNAMEEVIAVASACKANHGSCEGGRINSFSSRGLVTVAAPGDEILSAQSPSILAPLGQLLEGDYFGDTPQDEAQNRALYMRLSGTSMAAPHVAGVAALLLEANPDLTPAEVKQIISETADDMLIEGDEELVEGYDKASGHGLVNVRKALAAATLMKVENKSEGKASGRFGGAWTLLGMALLLPLGLRRVMRRV
jgi:serine protease AprX